MGRDFHVVDNIISMSGSMPEPMFVEFVGKGRELFGRIDLLWLLKVLFL